MSRLLANIQGSTQKDYTELILNNLLALSRITILL